MDSTTAGTLASAEAGAALPAREQVFVRIRAAPAVDRVIALDQVPHAIRDLTEGRVRGKIIIAT